MRAVAIGAGIPARVLGAPGLIGQMRSALYPVKRCFVIGDGIGSSGGNPLSVPLKNLPKAVALDIRERLPPYLQKTR